MILYKFKEEKDFILHYAKKLKNTVVERIILDGDVKFPEDADELARFFWEMVDAIVEDKENNTLVPGFSDLEAWNEYVFESIRAYFRNNGYEKEWDAHI
jgi:hypothetical protein